MLKPPELAEIVEQVAESAERSGLVLEPVHFELVDAPHLNILAAYGGMPVRYSYWGFGKTWGRLKLSSEYRQGMIYEMVINNRPAYAFLDRNIDPARARLVVAHVLAHVRFFRANRLFLSARQDAVAMMSRHRMLMEDMRLEHGERAVESLIEAGLTLADFTGDRAGAGFAAVQSSDVLGYVIASAPMLAEWERRLLWALHREARYFWPQILTKILNEGYATFWHRRIVRALSLSARDGWEAAKMHAELLASEAGQLNPYRLGLNLLVRAYAEGGLAAVDKASRELDDVGLIRAYLTAEDSRRWELALFTNRDDRIAGERSFAELKAVLIRDIEHGGLPHIVVNREMTEAKDGSLYLRHLHDGRDLDFRELPKALEPIAARLWGGRVVLSTVYQKLARVVYHDGREWQDQVTEGAISGLETNTAQ